MRLKGRLALAHRTVLNRFPIGTAVERPAGGWVLWVRLPEGVSGRALAAAAREQGVLLSAGADFLPDQSDVSAIRVSVARGTAGELEKALEIAGACARDLARQAARQKKGRAKSARDASDAQEAALIQI